MVTSCKAASLFMSAFERFLRLCVTKQSGFLQIKS